MKPKIIRYRTRDDPPMIGYWLRSTRRPRYSYLVLGVSCLGAYRVGGRVGLDPPIVYKLTVERRTADAPPSDAEIWPIYWDFRGRKNRQH